MERKKVTWADLKKFIDEQIEQEGESFLENQLMIECVSPESVSKSAGWKIKTGNDDWTYVEPAWSFGNKINVLFTHFKKEKIYTININY